MKSCKLTKNLGLVMTFIMMIMMLSCGGGSTIVNNPDPGIIGNTDNPGLVNPGDSPNVDPNVEPKLALSFIPAPYMPDGDFAPDEMLLQVVRSSNSFVYDTQRVAEGLNIDFEDPSRDRNVSTITAEDLEKFKPIAYLSIDEIHTELTTPRDLYSGGTLVASGVTGVTRWDYNSDRTYINTQGQVASRIAQVIELYPFAPHAQDVLDILVTTYTTGIMGQIFDDRIANDDLEVPPDSTNGTDRSYAGDGLVLLDLANILDGEPIANDMTEKSQRLLECTTDEFTARAYADRMIDNRGGLAWWDEEKYLEWARRCGRIDWSFDGADQMWIRLLDWEGELLGGWDYTNNSYCSFATLCYMGEQQPVLFAGSGAESLLQHFIGKITTVDTSDSFIQSFYNYAGFRDGALLYDDSQPTGDLLYSLAAIRATGVEESRLLTQLGDGAAEWFIDRVMEHSGGTVQTFYVGNIYGGEDNLDDAPSIHNGEVIWEVVSGAAVYLEHGRPHVVVPSGE